MSRLRRRPAVEDSYVASVAWAGGGIRLSRTDCPASRLLEGTMIHDSRAPSRRTIWIARAVAIVADAIQLALFPLFVEGFGSALNDVLDVVVCIVLVSLIGWSPLFLPTFLVEVLPFGDLAPTWTIAAFLATRSRDADRPPEMSQLEPVNGDSERGGRHEIPISPPPCNAPFL